ncbi:hypothetical protein VTL71DRAFT_15832, partial [Oculimacula yallundae]
MPQLRTQDPLTFVPPKYSCQCGWLPMQGTEERDRVLGYYYQDRVGQVYAGTSSGSAWGILGAPMSIDNIDTVESESGEG